MFYSGENSEEDLAGRDADLAGRDVTTSTRRCPRPRPSQSSRHTAGLAGAVGGPAGGAAVENSAVVEHIQSLHDVQGKIVKALQAIEQKVAVLSTPRSIDLS